MLATLNILCPKRDSEQLGFLDMSDTDEEAHQVLRNRAAKLSEKADDLFGPGWQSISAKDVGGDLVSAPRARLRKMEKKMVRESIPDFPSFCRAFHGYPLAGPRVAAPPPPPRASLSPRGAPPRKRPHIQQPPEPALCDEESDLDDFMEVDVAPAPSEHRTLGDRLLAVMRTARPLACKIASGPIFGAFFLVRMGTFLHRIMREEPDRQALLRGLRAEALEWQATVRKFGKELPVDDWVTGPLGVERPTAVECERKMDSWEDVLSRVTLARWHSTEFCDVAQPTVWGFALYLNRFLQQEEA